MKWTKDRPNKPGWYWVKPDPLCGFFHPVEVLRDTATATPVLHIKGENIDDFPWHTEWAGPMETPEW